VTSRFSAVTSISIFMRGSARPAEIIIAAGRGKRLGAHTDERPKGLVEVGSRSILGWQVMAFQDVGVFALVVIRGYKPEEMKAGVKKIHPRARFVDHPDWDGPNGYVGSETGAMYKVFARLADGKPSVAVVANGGGIPLAEIDENVRAGRPIVEVDGQRRGAARVPREREFHRRFRLTGRGHDAVGAAREVRILRDLNLVDVLE
jgi:hypothetical protein